MELQGTNVAAGVVPFTDQDTYWTHQAKYGKGGRMTGINSIAERDAIPMDRRELYMEVPIGEDVWTLKNGLENEDWEKAIPVTGGDGNEFLANDGTYKGVRTLEGEYVERTIFVAKNGSDDNDGTTKETAFATPDKALSSIKPNLYADISIVFDSANTWDLTNINNYSFSSYGGRLFLYGTPEDIDIYELTSDTVDTQKLYLKKDGVDVTLPTNTLKDTFRMTTVDGWEVNAFPNGYYTAYPTYLSDANYAISIVPASLTTNRFIKLTTVFQISDFTKIKVLPVTIANTGISLYIFHATIDVKPTETKTIQTPVNYNFNCCIINTLNVNFYILGGAATTVVNITRGTAALYCLRLVGRSSTFRGEYSYLITRDISTGTGALGVYMQVASGGEAVQLPSYWICDFPTPIYTGSCKGSVSILRSDTTQSNGRIIFSSTFENVTIATLWMPNRGINANTINGSLTVNKIVDQASDAQLFFSQGNYDNVQKVSFPSNYTNIDGTEGKEIPWTKFSKCPIIYCPTGTTKRIFLASLTNGTTFVTSYKSSEIRYLIRRKSKSTAESAITADTPMAVGMLKVVAYGNSAANTNKILKFEEFDRVETDNLTGVTFNIVRGSVVNLWHFIYLDVTVDSSSTEDIELSLDVNILR